MPGSADINAEHHPPPAILLVHDVAEGNQAETEPLDVEIIGPERDVERDPIDIVNGNEGSEEDAQEGVKAIEAVSKAWTKWGLIIAYFGIFLMAFTSSLQGQVVYPLSVIATSTFNNHSLISTVTVVQQVVNAVIKPPMAKIADVFGRLEAFTLSIALFILGMIQMALSSNVETYASAQIFYSAGSTGLQILQQVFIADTSDLLNRALWSSLPDTPFLVVVWIGPVIADRLSTRWRWAYGMWCVFLPLAFFPLALSLFINQRKAKNLGILKKSSYTGRGFFNIVKDVVLDLDIGGIIILSAAFALILIPLTITQNLPRGWQTPHIIAMILIGFLLLIAFPLWEASKKTSPHPLIPLYLLKSRTFCAGCGVGFFYFMVFYLTVYPYFYSYLLVVSNQSITAAGHITQVFSFTATVASIAVSMIIKYTRKVKGWITCGGIIYLLGIGIMIRFRDVNASTGQLIGAQIVIGIGGGMLNIPTQLVIQASVPHKNIAVATAVYLTVVEIGGAVGAAISGAIWSRNILPKLLEYLPEVSKDDAQKIYDSVTVADSYAVGSPERDAIVRSYQETMEILLTTAIFLAIPVILLTLLMDNYRLDKMEQHTNGRVIGTRIADVQGGGNSRTTDLVKRIGKSLGLGKFESAKREDGNIEMGNTVDS